MIVIRETNTETPRFYKILFSHFCELEHHTRIFDIVRCYTLKHSIEVGSELPSPRGHTSPHATPTGR